MLLDDRASGREFRVAPPDVWWLLKPAILPQRLMGESAIRLAHGDANGDDPGR